MDRAHPSDGDPERAGPSGFGGESPGEPFDLPDAPVASDKPGTTAEEQRERSLDRRLEMDEPDVSASDPSTGEPAARPVLDDDLAPEDIVAEDVDVRPEDADLDRTRQEAGEQSLDPAESAEESAMHIERE